MKTIEDMKLELLSDNSNKFMQTLIDYDIKSKDKYGSNLLHYYIMNYDSIVPVSYTHLTLPTKA